MSVNKLERLLNLTAALLATPRPLSADELRQKVEGYPPPGPAFHRTFERDKDDLRVLGIPLRVERVPASDPPLDGYRIAPEDYYLPDPGLEADELAALHLASLTVRLEGFGGQEALWKLGGVGAAASLDGGTAQSPGDPGVVKDVVASLPGHPALVPVFQAISEKRVVTFGYRGEERRVEPWRLDFQRGRWYLTGYDRVRAGQRNFRLDRIEGQVETTNETAEAEPPPATDGAADQPARPWEVGAETPTEARLLVDAERVEAARHQLGPDIDVEERDDGSAVFTVPVVNHDAFRSFVLGFLDGAELLSPPAWRDDLVAWLRAIVDGEPVVA
jgi:proteasome accessory factor B